MTRESTVDNRHEYIYIYIYMLSSASMTVTWSSFGVHRRCRGRLLILNFRFLRLEFKRGIATCMRGRERERKRGWEREKAMSGELHYNKQPMYFRRPLPCCKGYTGSCERPIYVCVCVCVLMCSYVVKGKQFSIFLQFYRILLPASEQPMNCSHLPTPQNNAARIRERERERERAKSVVVALPV